MIRKQQYVRKSISNMTEGYDYYDTEILLNGIPVGGLSSQTIADCDYTVKIPMSHGVDSLNVAAASAVAFWELGYINRRK